MSEPTIQQEVNYVPKKLVVKHWIGYLRRHLNSKERRMFETVRYESHINRLLSNLYHQCGQRGLYIPELTLMIGNCLFESLNYHRIGKDPIQLRRAMAFFFFQFKDFPGLFPTDPETIAQKFAIEKFVLPSYVHCRTNKTNYRLSYETMCQDMADDRSWTKLPANTMLFVASYMFHLRIVVINSESATATNEVVINAWAEASAEEKDRVRTIYLGQLMERHYVPLDVLGPDEIIDPMFYDDALNEFIVWRKKQMRWRFRQRKHDYRRRHRRKGACTTTAATGHVHHHQAHQPRHNFGLLDQESDDDTTDGGRKPSSSTKPKPKPKPTVSSQFVSLVDKLDSE